MGLIKENLNTTIRNSQWRDEDSDDHEDLGYLQILSQKYETTADLLLERLLEANVPGHLFVSLLMAQIARVSFEKNEFAQPHEMLSSITQGIKAVLHKLKAPQPTGEELRRALREYEFCLPSTEELLLVDMQATNWTLLLRMFNLPFLFFILRRNILLLLVPGF